MDDPNISRTNFFTSTLRRILFYSLCTISFSGLLNAEVNLPSEGPDSLAKATRLRIDGQYEKAVTVLERYLEAHPENARATLLLAQTYYWLNNVESAQRFFEMGLRRHPANDSLRLEYARMLVEMNRGEQARPLLYQLLKDTDAAPEALYLLGKLFYWEGNLSRARNYLRTALRLDPRNFHAKRLLYEMNQLTAPWIRLGSTYQHDSQPLKQWDSFLEGGWFVTPRLPVSIIARSQNFSISGKTPASSSLEAAFKQRWPGSDLVTEAAAGVLRQSFASRIDWTGRLLVSIRVSKQFVLDVAAMRFPYLFTTSSLSEPVMVQSVGGSLGWETSRGWSGKAGYRKEHYPDANTANSVYSWLFVPLHHSFSLELLAGYAFNYQDARENRFTPAKEPPSHSKEDEDDQIQGVYVPYYTPRNLQRHDILGAVVVKFQNRVSLYFNMSYGVYATEDAPYFQSEDDDDDERETNTRRGFYDRRFYPWKVNGRINADITSRITLVLYGEHQRTAFYETTYLGINFLFRMLSR